MRKNLVKIVSSALVSLSLAGCIQDNYQPALGPVLKIPRSKPMPSRTLKNQELMAELGNQNIVLFNKFLQKSQFRAYSKDGDLKDRFIYHRGEKCIVEADIPKELYGFLIDFSVRDPYGDIIARSFERISSEEHKLSYALDVSDLLNRKGPGVYQGNWVIDGSPACIQFFEFRE